MRSWWMPLSAAWALTPRCKLRCNNAVRNTRLPRATLRHPYIGRRAGTLSAAYADVLRAAPVLDGRVFVEVYARGRVPIADARWFARAAWQAAAYISACVDESAAIGCLLDTGELNRERGCVNVVCGYVLTAAVQARCGSRL